MIVRRSINRHRFAFYTLLLSLFVSTNLLASEKPLTSEQQDFLETFDLIKTQQRSKLAELKSRLKNHPLYPQLLYQDYIKNLDKTPETVIFQFIDQFAHLALADNLRHHWLTHLGDQQNWLALLEHQPDQTEDLRLRCHFFRAKLETQPDTVELNTLHQFWLQQPKMHGACKPIEQFLIQHKQLPGWLIWQKIDRAMTLNQISNVRRLAKLLSVQDQNAVQEWLNYHRQPDKLINKLPKTHSPFIDRKIFLHALTRLANRQPQATRQLLDLHQQGYQIQPSERRPIERLASLRLAYRYDAQASQYLDRYNREEADDDTLQWRAQIAIRESDWMSLLNTISHMDIPVRQELKWQYWTARALEGIGQNKQANDIYQQLAKNRHYYGFLAADRIDQDYRLQSVAVDNIALSPSAIRKKYPALDLIEQLLAIGWHINAEREWQHLLNHADSEDLSAIALLANQWQHHTYAIRALAFGKNWDLLELRFPTPYNEPVMQNAEKNQINAAWIYSIIRRESAYMDHARSSAGAVGLMQLLPSTARYISKQIGQSQYQYQSLTDAQSNIELGSAYLRYLLDKYQGHLVMATAAYNAGPKRIDSWRPNVHPMEADQWVEAIPFQETRKYVKSILEYKVVFETLLGQQPQKLKTLMLPIPASANLAEVSTENR